MITRIKERIQRKIEEYVTEADETSDMEGSIILRALADGLEEALTIIEDEEL